MAKYKPTIGDTIKFKYGDTTDSGKITFVGEKFVSLYPHTVPITNAKGEPMQCDLMVENGNILNKLERKV